MQPKLLYKEYNSKEGSTTTYLTEFTNSHLVKYANVSLVLITDLWEKDCQIGLVFGGDI